MSSFDQHKPNLDFLASIFNKFGVELAVCLDFDPKGLMLYKFPKKISDLEKVKVDGFDVFKFEASQGKIFASPFTRKLGKQPLNFAPPPGTMTNSKETIIKEYINLIILLYQYGHSGKITKMKR